MIRSIFFDKLYSRKSTPHIQYPLSTISVDIILGSGNIFSISFDICHCQQAGSRAELGYIIFFNSTRIAFTASGGVA
jgi:hypothetical protein